MYPAWPHARVDGTRLTGRPFYRTISSRGRAIQSGSGSGSRLRRSPGGSRRASGLCAALIARADPLSGAQR